MNTNKLSLDLIKAKMNKYAKSHPTVWYKNPLSLKIMQDKYLHSGESTAEELIYRVSSIFSEKLALNVANLMIKGSFFPGGRSLYGAGSKGKFNATMSNCFVAGTNVLTTVGYKPIECVNIGDMVITSQGVHRVNNTMCRRYKGDLYKLSSELFLNNHIICTPNHQFLTPNGWVRADRFFSAKEIHTTMRIKTLEYQFQKEYPDIDLLAYYENTNRDRVALLEDGKIVHETHNLNTDSWHSYGSASINRYIKMDKDFRYFIGRWLGDGSITRKKEARDHTILQIVFNATTEVEAANRCIAIGSKAFGVMPSVRYTEQNVIAVRWENPIIGNFFYKEFGAGCDHKHVDLKYYGDLDMALGLLDSDGSIDSHGLVKITLNSLSLIHWLRFTLAMNGIVANGMSVVNQRNALELRIPTALSRKYLIPFMSKTYYDGRHNIQHSDENADWAIVRNVEVIENVDTYVYNLSVDDVHEYNVNNVICHNCYTCPNVGDSLEEIYESNKEIAKIFKTGGGIGINLSNLRPNGAKTNNAARTSTGAVSFIHLYNATGSIIGFHGRRGATLVGLNISHPDIEEFVGLRSKYDLSAMNISCIITDDFMQAVQNKRTFRLHFHVDATGEDIEKEIDAYSLYHKICQMNWDYGDPGMLFKTAVDTHNFMEFEPEFKIDICNPCAEYTGPAYNSCNLGSMNLYNYVKEPFSPRTYFDFAEFGRDVRTATAALDEILDYGYDLQPLDENRKVIDQWRSIGLGYFGFADALIALGVKYGSKESITFADMVTKALTKAAIDESSMRAQALGSFGNFVKTHVVKSRLLRELGMKNVVQNRGLRNAQLISIAPTGSLALLAGSLSSGIEPIFQCQYERSTHGLEDQKISFTVADRAIMDLLKFHNIEPGSISTEELKARFPFIVEAADIDPIHRIAVQAAMQQNMDNAISSTVNLPESATVEDIEKIYMKAWESGLKGITVFRDNCKRASILGFNKDKDKNDRKEEKKECTCHCKEKKLDSITPIGRKDKGALSGRTYRKRTACVKALYVTINRDEDNNIFEVFTNKSTHGCSANIATITRMTSLALRSGIKVETIIQELKENSCQACQQLIKAGQKDVSLSCPYAIGEALEEEYTYLKKNKTDIRAKVEEVKEKVNELNEVIATKKKETAASIKTTDVVIPLPEKGQTDVLKMLGIDNDHVGLSRDVYVSKFIVKDAYVKAGEEIYNEDTKKIEIATTDGIANVVITIDHPIHSVTYGDKYIRKFDRDINSKVATSATAVRTEIFTLTGVMDLYFNRFNFAASSDNIIGLVLTVSLVLIDNQQESSETKRSIPMALECPECGERTLIIEGKCTSCKRCGYSKCD